MWEFVKVNERHIEIIKDYLKKGYEPFAVSTDVSGWNTIWFRREVKREVEDEIPDKQTADDTGRSRRATTTAKG